MRQAGGAEHQRQTQGNRFDRVADHRARAHDRLFLGMDGDCLLEHCFHAEAASSHVQCAEGDDRRAREQQDGLDDLHPGGREHAADGDVDDDQDADQNDRVDILQTEQHLDQLAGADHLADQVQDHHHQRAGRGHGAHRHALEAVGHHVGIGVLAEVAQLFSHQEHDDRPADQPAHRVDQAVIAIGEHQAGNAQEGGGGHVVASDGQTVLEAGDATASGVEVLGGLGALGGPVSNAQGRANEGQEHDDGGDIERLLLDFATHVTGGKGNPGEEGQCNGRKRALPETHSTSSLISLFSLSKTVFARYT